MLGAIIIMPEINWMGRTVTVWYFKGAYGEDIFVSASLEEPRSAVSDLFLESTCPSTHESSGAYWSQSLFFLGEQALFIF